MLGSAAKALIFLIATGFIAGFALSSGPTRLLLRAYTSPAQAAGEGGDPAGGSADNGGKGGQKGSVETDGKQAAHGGGDGTGDTAAAHSGVTQAKLDDDDGGDAPAPGAERGGQGVQPSGLPAQVGHGAANRMAAAAAIRDAKRGDGERGDHTGDGPPPAAAGPPPASFLVGNTMQTTQGDQTTIRYLSSKGWEGEQVRGSLIVRRWIVQGNRLCVVSDANVASCETITVAREPKPQRGTGVVLGTVTMEAGVRWTVRRGNTAGLPETIPLIIGEQSGEPDPASAKPSAVGQAAVTAMVGRTLLKTGDKAAPLGERYEPDGLWVNAQPLDAAAKTGLGGVRVGVGRWRFAAGLLCVDEPGLELKTDCAVPEQWGKQTFRLRSVRPARVTTMVGVATF